MKKIEQSNQASSFIDTVQYKTGGNYLEAPTRRAGKIVRREKAINLTGERSVDRKRGDVIRYLVLVDWLVIVATIVCRPGWSTIQFFHESRRDVAGFPHGRRVPVIFVNLSPY